MKNTLLTTFLALILLSCSKNENIEPSGVTLEDAELSQLISFKYNDLERELTEFKNNSWPFGGIIRADNIQYDPNIYHPISRAIYASVPKEQSQKNHIETFGLIFTHVFPKSEIDIESNKIIDNEIFKTDFLNIGKLSISLSNFGYHETYIIGVGQANESSLKITKIENILEHDNLMLVTGEFYGSLAYELEDRSKPIGDFYLSNGKFKVIIEN